MARLVKIDRLRSPVQFTYTDNSIYHYGSSAARGGYVVVPRRTGEQDCRGLRKILCGGELAGKQVAQRATMLT